jgi:hypothetical protein
MAEPAALKSRAFISYSHADTNWPNGCNGYPMCEIRVFLSSPAATPQVNHVATCNPLALRARIRRPVKLEVT